MEKYDEKDYLCDPACGVDLNGYFRDVTSRTDCAATGGLHGRQRDEGVVGRLLARPRGSRALPSLLVRRPGPRALHVSVTLRGVTPAIQVGGRTMFIRERPAIGGLRHLSKPISYGKYQN